MLTPPAVRAAIKATSGANKATALNDGGGLSLLVQPSGAGWWRLRYWLASRQNRLSLGTCPEVTLAEARVRRDEARKLIAAGTDPSNQRKTDKAEQAEKAKAARLVAEGQPGPGTFEAAAREWLATIHEVKVSAGHAERTWIRLQQDVFPWIGNRLIGEIEPPELLHA